jgi:uncharacterized NAD(P)/FAD-binding protein YdhS
MDGADDVKFYQASGASYMFSEHPFDVAVIGDGASGTLLASQYSRHASPSSRLILIGSAARPGRGVAYETPFRANVLNVPAGNMSAFPRDKLHFVRWLVSRLPDADEGTFAPRSIYGDYLTEIFDETLQSDLVQSVKATATGLKLRSGIWIVQLHDGASIKARSVVLAIGNALIPADPLDVSRIVPFYRGTPWSEDAVRGLASDASVLLIGTGLTTVDVALSLRESGHKGKIHAVSRHGKLYHHHQPYTLQPLNELPREFRTPLSALRWVRSAIDRLQSNGEDWRAVIDSLRPYLPEIWQKWSLQQRAAFLRHIRNLWDIHRHRMAPEVYSHLNTLLANGTLTIHTGRLLKAESDCAHASITIRRAHTEETFVLNADRVINCTGPSRNYLTTNLSLISEMRDQGLLNPDPLRLGIETDTDGTLIGSDGGKIQNMFAIGPLRIPTLFESIAIPEIRVQAEELAKLLVSESRRI